MIDSSCIPICLHAAWSRGVSDGTSLLVHTAHECCLRYRNIMRVLAVEVIFTGLKQVLEKSSDASHWAFSSNLFHGNIVQKYINQMSPPENKKCWPGKVFGMKPPSNLATFEQEGPQMPGCEAVSTLHQPKNDML